MRKCLLCGEQTNGSIGAAGIVWHNLCQPCKDKEDNALLQKIEYQTKCLKLVTESLEPIGG